MYTSKSLRYKDNVWQWCSEVLRKMLKKDEC